MVAIVGPTASGKTELALTLAQENNGEIICADSRTVYRGMDLGTAKPSPEQRRRAPHHMLDTINPGERMTAAEFKVGAMSLIEEITTRGNVPFLVGGTGLYVDAVLYDYQFPEEIEYRHMVQLEAMSGHELLALLEAEDPEARQRIDIKNRRRVIRAVITAGQPRSRSQSIRPRTLVLGLRVSKEVAQKRIALRLENSLARGLIDEVRRLGEEYGWGSEAMTGIAYKAFSGVVLGAKSLADAKSECIRGELALWKRQVTWFKRNPDIVWLTDPAEGGPLVSSFLESL
jgi:tRNA dimethylallyltransferase